MNTTEKKITLFDASVCLECLSADLMDISAALQVFDESLGMDGFQQEKINEWEAVLFAKRLPLYISLLRVIKNDLSGIIHGIDADADTLRKAHDVQKEVSASACQSIDP